MAISSPGIGSGLDINSLVTQLMNAEQVPLRALQAKASSYNAKLSAYGNLKNAISTFQDALKGLSGDALKARTASSSNADILGVSASSAAMPGNYAIQVTQLARQHSIASAGFASTSEKLGNGSMSLHIGGGASLLKIEGDFSLKELSDKINGANVGVTATIINDGTNNYLSISSNETGTKNAVTITDTSGGLAPFGSANMTPPQIPEDLDAKFTINGIKITKSSNTVTDAIAGLTFTLNKESAGTTVNVAVAHNKDNVKSAVKNFVSAFNTLSTKIKSLTSYDATSKKGGELNGDQGAASLLTTIRKELGTAVAGSDLTTLSEIGVTFQRDGQLAVDEAKLQKVLDTGFNKVVQLFSSVNGYTTRLTKLTDNMLSSSGVISSRTTGLQSSIKGIEKSQEALELRLQATEKRLRAQFSALDTALSSMQSTSSYLSQQLAALSNTSN